MKIPQLSFCKKIMASVCAAGLISLPVSAEHAFESLTITEVVAQSGGEFDRNTRDYDILLNAVLAAELQDALADPEADLTVFAPSDKAFIRLARDLGFEGNDEAGAFTAIVDTLTILGNGDPIPLLTDVLLYHVVPFSKTFREVTRAPSIDTLFESAGLVPNRRTLIDNDPDFKNPRLVKRASNIFASNGIIHTIDRVLIPADLPNDTSALVTITDLVAASGGEFDHNFLDYDILLNAVLAAGLDGALADPEANLTVFAPTDLAFVRLAYALGFRGWGEANAFDFIVMTLTDLGGGDPIPLLTNILLYHVSPDTQILNDVLQSDEITTLLEGATFSPRGRQLIDNDPGIRDPKLFVRASDLRASNGIVHTITRVLVPINVSNTDTRH